jgi:translocator protein
LAGVIGSIPNVSAIPTWYAGLNKPSFTPPNWLFAPAWITLYAMMAVAAFLIWRKGLNNAAIKTALVYFVVQLILNAAWSWIFFGLKLPLAAFLEILALWIMILITTLKFRAIAPTAAIVMIPYLIWVSYASVLNYSLWRMNY